MLGCLKSRRGNQAVAADGRAEVCPCLLSVVSKAQSRFVGLNSLILIIQNQLFIGVQNNSFFVHGRVGQPGLGGLLAWDGSKGLGTQRSGERPEFSGMHSAMYKGEFCRRG